MEVPSLAGVLGVVVVHRLSQPVAELPAVSELLPQVDELLVVRNGSEADVDVGRTPAGIRSLCFASNLGVAAAWNAALDYALERHHRYLYILDHDSAPSADAVVTALAQLRSDGAAAVVQPPSPDRLRLDPFPWNTVASGSLYDVRALHGAGGFDERLFVDEVDHEVLARLLGSGHKVSTLPRATIVHKVGSPRDIRFLGWKATVSGHDVERRRLQGQSAGQLLRRYVRSTPTTAARLLLRHLLTAAKDVAAGEQFSARCLLSGLLGGVATRNPPARAAARSCPYCEGPLVGRFAAVADWRYGTGPPADVYRCCRCGALAAGRVPSSEEVASWYSEYYTHGLEPVRARAWSRVWPTPRRRGEMELLKWYLTAPASRGRFLEVGTGTGERLVQFADAGWDVVGQDPDPKAGRLARDRGIEVYECDVADLVGRERPFDLIGLTHVLEHVADPVDLLRSCAALLAPGGRICVIAPNAGALGRLLFGRWWFGLEQPRHLAIPTLESLQRLTSRLGLELIDARGASTNAAVILGGSLDRRLREHLPPGRLRRGVQFSMALIGQALGRAATLLDHRLGEEIVWLARQPEAAARSVRPVSESLPR